MNEIFYRNHTGKFAHFRKYLKDVEPERKDGEVKSEKEEKEKQKKESKDGSSPVL